MRGCFRCPGSEQSKAGQQVGGNGQAGAQVGQTRDGQMEGGGTGAACTGAGGAQETSFSEAPGDSSVLPG